MAAAAESRRADNPAAKMQRSIVIMGAASNGSVAEVVRRMLSERSITGELSEDADLREVGLTSLDMVDLVLSVERAFDVQIPEAQITPANFRSIAAIDALLDTLRGGSFRN